MRDPLFEHDDPSLAATQRAAATARAEARQLLDAEDLVVGLAEWCRQTLFGTDILDPGPDGSNLSDLLALPGSTSLTFEFVRNVKKRQSLQTGFTALLENREDPRKHVAAWLFGTGLANAITKEFVVADGSAGRVLSGVWDLVSSNALMSVAFGEAIPELLRRSPLAFQALLRDLNARFEDINRDPGLGTYSGEREAFNALVGTLRSEKSLLKNWLARDPWFPVHYNLLNLVPLILPVDRVRVLELVDAFDFPHPIRQILQHHTFLHDRDEIAAALGAAPICRDDECSWNHRLTVLLILEAAERHCHDRWQIVRRQDDLDGALLATMEKATAVLSSWVEGLAQIVMERRDGDFLGSQWLLLKASDERTHRPHGATAGEPHQDYLRQDDLIEWIAVGLSRAGLSGKHLAAQSDFPDRSSTRKFSPLPPEPADGRQPSVHLDGLSMMTVLDHMINEGCDVDPGKNITLLDALLGTRDPAFDREAALDPTAGGLPANSCGLLFARAKEPTLRWRKSWELLTEQRRRVQHWRETQDSDALAPSLFLLAAGTSGVDWLTNHNRRDKAGELWREVFEGARECWLTISLAHLVERIETHIGRLFARHPAVFGESEGQGESESATVVDDYGEVLARDLGYLGGNDRMLAICCLNAFRNGARPTTMDKVLKDNSGQVDALLRQFERWQEYERPVRRRSDILEELAGLRTEIDRLGES
ncbi:MAG: hypothetical protein OXF11_02780 [Deltaproteobacteria bacterium]|nr:hypothetical protein [Deltaproteobacteria bacterium]